AVGESLLVVAPAAAGAAAPWLAPHFGQNAAPPTSVPHALQNAIADLPPSLNAREGSTRTAAATSVSGRASIMIFLETYLLAILTNSRLGAACSSAAPAA